MNEIIKYLSSLPPVVAAIIAPALIFGLLWLKSEVFRRVVGRFLPTPGRKIAQVLDLVLEEGFESMHKRSRLEFVDLRSRRFEIVDEIVLSVYLKICRLFDEAIDKAKLETDLSLCSFHVSNEKKLFEAVARMLLNLSSMKVSRFFEKLDSSEVSEIEFRKWLEDRLEALRHDVERQFYNSYPEEGLILSRQAIEELVQRNKSDIRDAFFSIGFRVRDLEREIAKKVEEEENRFHETKKKIFSEILLGK